MSTTQVQVQKRGESFIYAACQEFGLPSPVRERALEIASELLEDPPRYTHGNHRGKEIRREAFYVYGFFIAAKAEGSVTTRQLLAFAKQAGLQVRTMHLMHLQLERPYEVILPKVEDLVRSALEAFPPRIDAAQQDKVVSEATRVTEAELASGRSGGYDKKTVVGAAIYFALKKAGFNQHSGLNSEKIAAALSRKPASVLAYYSNMLAR